MIPDLFFNSQPWTFKYFLENSSTLRRRKRRERDYIVLLILLLDVNNHIESSHNLHSFITSSYFIMSKEIKELVEKTYLEHNDKSQSGC